MNDNTPLDRLAVQLSERYEYQPVLGAPTAYRNRSWFLGPDRCAILWACAYLTTRVQEDGRAAGRWADREDLAIEPAMVAALTGHSLDNTRHKMVGLTSKGWLAKVQNRPVLYRIAF